jgi:cytochrome c-type biogenesis protein CcmE
MTMRRKLIIAGGFVVGVTAYMAYLGAASSWQYYVTVDECLADSARFAGQRIRVSGKIAADTLQIAENRRQVNFAMQGTDGQLPVVYAGPLPDKLANGIDVVVEGRLDGSGVIRAEKLLTRCASKYQSQMPSGPPPHDMPPEAEARP